MSRRSRPPNKVGCKPDGDVCVAHDMPRECPHGCTYAEPHTCGGRLVAPEGYAARQLEAKVNTAIEEGRNGWPFGENPEGAITLFACGPNTTCDHDYRGWVEVGNGGSARCAKCGALAIEEAMWGDD